RIAADDGTDVVEHAAEALLFEVAAAALQGAAERPGGPAEHAFLWSALADGAAQRLHAAADRRRRIVRPFAAVAGHVADGAPHVGGSILGLLDQVAGGVTGLLHHIAAGLAGLLGNVAGGLLGLVLDVGGGLAEVAPFVVLPGGRIRHDVPPSSCKNA